MKTKFIKASLNKCRKMGSRVIQSSESCCCTQWCCFWAPSKPPKHAAAEKFIPKDVPRGHVVVYVGQDHKRFVVKIKLLNHPLFRALLEQARDQYDADSTPPKLWIPCPESVFLQVLQCAR